LFPFTYEYNLSAKADKSKSGAALPLVQIIGFANYYKLLAYLLRKFQSASLIFLNDSACAFASQREFSIP
jgi:hypothetical protein